MRFLIVAGFKKKKIRARSNFFVLTRKCRLKKVADNIADPFIDNTLTEWSVAVSCLNLKQDHIYENGITARGAHGYVAGFGFGTMPVSARIKRLKKIIKTLVTFR